ncbi:carbohydrate ABC transporter permease [Paenibacillus radicis (ex Xue et al. 2023)]|uniref:Carbohydrate ABC transporter permease n=1 Tax=Paenibacillus radicis (ex Xue et al. 2023) TaxID=2972489 RepID=A0ABT1YEX6_9BACL|nr:carbohydrate ABC transporter permease [Paenibacillus radicis (ex Xue et al. 2023)]MCR8631729.1 carbohydrate ABC transporter permease [Paenibacillus radicis (ex Xue et al. 2023)]
MKKNGALRWVYPVLTLLVIMVFAFPFIWMLLASFKTQAQIMSKGQFLFFTPTMKNYVNVFGQYEFMRFIVNSFIVAVGSTAGSLLLGLPAAYAIARYRLQGLGLVILVARIVPGITFLIPWFILFSNLKLVDTYLALILSHMLVGLPFIIWIMISFFEGLPTEIEEAGLIDGCTRSQVFLRIILPISGPGIITSSLLSFIFSWNNFMFSIILAGDKTKTLPIAVFNFMSYSEINWGALMAAACIITLPVLIIALLAQRYIVSGLAAGAVKG